jgi:hypothetical protein
MTQKNERTLLLLGQLPVHEHIGKVRSHVESVCANKKLREKPFFVVIATQAIYDVEVSVYGFETPEEREKELEETVSEATARYENSIPLFSIFLDMNDFEYRPKRTASVIQSELTANYLSHQDK